MSTIIIVPFYHIRLPIFSASLSILTISCILLDLFLFFTYLKNIPIFFSKDALWLYAVLFLCAFAPSLFLYPNIHAFGVFAEWLYIPACTGFLIAAHITHHPRSIYGIIFALIASLCIVIVISLTCLFQGIVTFDHRLTAFFLSPNHLALYIAPLICITGVLCLHKNILFHTFSILVIFCALCTLFFTHSFNTVFALACAIICAAFYCFKNKLFLLSLISIIILVVSFSGYHKILLSDPDFTHNSLGSRVAIWNTAIFLIQKQPLFGYEIDSFQAQYLAAQRFFLPYPNWAVPTPHNLSLTLFFSGGFFSLLFFSIISSRVLYILYVQIHLLKNQFALFYGAAFITVLFASIADTPFWKNDLSFLFWIFVVLIYIKNQPFAKKITDSFPHPKSVTEQKA